MVAWNTLHKVSFIWSHDEINILNTDAWLSVFVVPLKVYWCVIIAQSFVQKFKCLVYLVIPFVQKLFCV